MRPNAFRTAFLGAAGALALAVGGTPAGLVLAQGLGVGADASVGGVGVGVGAGASVGGDGGPGPAPAPEPRSARCQASGGSGEREAAGRVAPMPGAVPRRGGLGASAGRVPRPRRRGTARRRGATAPPSRRPISVPFPTTAATAAAADIATSRGSIPKPPPSGGRDSSEVGSLLRPFVTPAHPQPRPASLAWRRPPRVRRAAARCRQGRGRPPCAALLSAPARAHYRQPRSRPRWFLGAAPAASPTYRQAKPPRTLKRRRPRPRESPRWTKSGGPFGPLAARSAMAAEAPPRRCGQ